MKTFTDYKIKDLSLKNRIVMPPMCVYSSDNSGMVKDFHLDHYSSRAMGGVGFIIVEATSIESRGRLSNHDLGIWDDDHIDGLKSLVDRIHSYDSKVAIQLAHAGRKATSDDEDLVAPSALRHSQKYKKPRELSKNQIKDLVKSFKEAVRRSHEAGFDAIEIHGAHGYLIHQFLSPLTNKREDEYGGSLENRTRFLREILSEIREVWPEKKPILLRVSASDYADGGLHVDDIVDIINLLEDSIDMVHVSSGGLVDTSFDIYPGYQLNFSDIIRRETGLPTIAVGLLSDYKQSEEILYSGKADLVAFGRALLRNPYLPLNMAYENDIKINYPDQYSRGFNLPKALV